MKSCVSLCVVFVCLIAVDARLLRYSDIVVVPSRDREVAPANDWEYIPERPAKRSRMCLINAGLSQGCDLSDIIMAKQQASKFMSFAGPGRR